MDTSLDILASSGGVPTADISGLHAAFTGGTYLEPDFDITVFNGVASQVKLIKQIKDSCSNISSALEIIYTADPLTSDFEIECGSSIAFNKVTQEFTATYADNTDIALPHTPLSGSVSVFKNNSQILEETTHFNIVGTNIRILQGSDEPTPTDKDIFIIQYAYNT